MTAGVIESNKMKIIQNIILANLVITPPSIYYSKWNCQKLYKFVGRTNKKLCKI